jgi:hypothetical protein
MPKTARSLADKILDYIYADPIGFAKKLTLMAWGWKELDAWQMKVLASSNRHLMLLCSRQSGKSSILAVKAFIKALTVPDALILIIAEQRQSNEDMRKVKELSRAFDEWLRDTYAGEVRFTPISDNITSIEWSNGARIVALPANEKVRGFSAPTMVIMDEAAYQPDETFVAVDPMMTVSQGQMILASTPSGTNGFFATEFRNPRYEMIRVPWTECPRIKPDEIAIKRELYGEAYVKQEYETIFLDDIQALFTERSLRESIDDEEDILAEEISAFEKTLPMEAELI